MKKELTSLEEANLIMDEIKFKVDMLNVELESSHVYCVTWRIKKKNGRLMLKCNYLLNEETQIRELLRDKAYSMILDRIRVRFQGFYKKGGARRLLFPFYIFGKEIYLFLMPFALRFSNIRILSDYYIDSKMPHLRKL